MFGLISKEVTIMSNPDRYDYDRGEFYYDEDLDELRAWDSDERYTGDGELITDYSD